MSDLGNVIEILHYAKVTDVTSEKVQEIMDSTDEDLTYSEIIKQYIEKFRPDLFQKLYVESTQEIIDYSQYDNFLKFADEKKMIVQGFLRHNNTNLEHWPLDLNAVISMYYAYFIVCNVRSSNYNYMSPHGQIMETYCCIDGEHLEMNNKPQHEGVEGRGMHFIALDDVHGNALTVHNFDTWASEEDGKQFQRVCSNVRDNSVVIVFAKDSAEWFSPRGLNVLHTKYGIRTQSIGFRQTFICVFQRKRERKLETEQEAAPYSKIHFEFVGHARENPSIAYRAAIKLSQCV